MSSSFLVHRSARGLCLFVPLFIVFLGLGHVLIHAAAASNGQLRVSPGNLDFETVVLGRTETLPFRIENTSLATLHLYRVSSSSSQFNVSGPSLPISLEPSKSVEFNMSFQPNALGKTSALLEIVSSALSMTSFTLTGVGKEPLAALQLSPPSLDFGSQKLNSRSTEKITVRNTGDVPLTISGVTVTGAGFAFSKLSPGRSLAPQEQTVLKVSFQPFSPGTVSGKISILSSSLPSAASVPLMGSSVDPSPQISTPLSTHSATTAVAAVSSTRSSIHASYASTATTSHTSNTSTATASPPQVYLSWESSPGVVVGYRVYRSTVSGGPYPNYTTAPIPALNYTDTGVVAGATYYYVVTSIDASGVESIYSNQAVAAVPSSPVPSPPPSGPIGLIAGLDLNGSAALNGSSLRLTTTGDNLAGSAWYPTAVNVQAFSTDFTFQQANPASNCIADGFAFVVQNEGTTALGPSGGGLGYGPDNPTYPSGSSNAPIAKSVAIKFDLYNNAGEGPNSTGIYTNGASPTIPAVTLGGGVDLHSGDIFHVHTSYDGTTLTMTITATANTAQTFTTSWPINIPGTVGGNTAYVGFTGGTGGCVSNQDILTWSYSPSTPTPARTPIPTPKTPIVYRSAALPAVSSGPTLGSLTYGGFPDTTGTILDATSIIGNNVTFTVNVAAAGTYDVKLSYKRYKTRGISQFTINGTSVGGPLDQYLDTDGYATVDYGNFTFESAGNYSFKFTIIGKNPSSTGYSVSFDDFTLTPQ